MPYKLLITGVAGFIGFHTAHRLLERKIDVFGIDSFTPYYDPLLKEKRAALLQAKGAKIYRYNVEDQEKIISVIRENNITHIVHLAAQAGVRHSLQEPWTYLRSNVNGFLSLLEALRLFPHIRTVWASSSSVYGLNQKVPFSEKDISDQPANLYGATKKANEMMAHSYHHLFGLSLIGLRFFTVYGPWGRPDMAYYSFAEKIMNGEPIQLFGKEDLKRDFTYIDDIVDGILAALFQNHIHYNIYNLGDSQPQSVLTLVANLERALGKKANIEFMKRPKGDIAVTYADISRAEKELGFYPKITLQEGIEKFCNWYQWFRVQDAI